MSKKVSIIIPCYKQAKYLSEAIESALNQTYENLEIVCVNDASPDNTTEVVQQFVQKYDNVKLVDLKENGGLSHARNSGIEACSGEYILPLDADDKIDKNYVKKAAEILDKNENVGIVYCEAELFGAKTGKWELPDYDKETFIFANCIFCTALFRKSDWLRAGKYNETMKIAWEDWDLWLSFIELGLEPYKIPETMFFYRKHNYQSMVEKSGQFQREIYIQITTNHPKLYFENDTVLKRIFDPWNTVQCKTIHKKYRKYKKLFDWFIIAFICETLLILFYVLYILLMR